MSPVELGWPVQANTGWGLFALHLALGLHRQGRRVHLPASDLKGVPATLRPTLMEMMGPSNHSERRIRFDTWGNHSPPFQPIPNRYRVLLAVFEDTEAINAETMQQYNLVLAPSRWIQSLLTARGIASTLWHQGVNDALFHPAPRQRAKDDGRFIVFSGGKLEQRKAQDCVLAAFREFRETSEGKNAILATAWQNVFPQTMEGIWDAGHVKGFPVMRNTTLDMAAWAEANGVPRESFIDLGLLSQAEMAHVIRECDVAIFPNRCEGATNLALVETLACGVPCIIGNWTGQADVVELVECSALLNDRTTPAPCRLYNGMQGWVEPSIPECVAALKFATGYCSSQPLASEMAIQHFSWSGRTAELHTILSAVADG